MNKPMSEDMIKETHRILVFGIDNHHSDGTSTLYQSYGGKYRNCQVHTGGTAFVVPRAIPANMARMVEQFNQDEKKAELDPFKFAAKYSDAFVQIHPFEDGNGRVSRLIFNGVLIKYVGLTIDIGGEEETRRGYLDIMRRSSAEMGTGEELAGLVLEKSVGRLRDLGRSLIIGG